MTGPAPPRYTGPDVDVVSDRTTRLTTVTTVLAVLLGAVVWGVWLGWDGAFTYYVEDGTSVSRYSELQGTGCVISLVVVTAAFACRGWPVAGAAGVSLGFWLPWTVDAVLAYRNQFVGVGALFMAMGLAGGTAIVAWLATAVAAGVRRS